MSLNERKEAYKQIHVKAKELGLGEDAYKNTLKALTGFTSCTDLRPTELLNVIDFLTKSDTHSPDCSCDDCALEVLA